MKRMNAVRFELSGLICSHLAISRTQLATLAASLITLAGCHEPKADQPPPVSPTSCQDFAARVCAEANSASPLCKATKETVEVMATDACALALTNFDTSAKKIAEKRKPCTDLVSKICADLGADTQSCEMVKTSTPGFSSERCAGMLSQYDQVLKPLKLQEAKKKPLSPEVIAKLAAGANAPAFGPADAKVTVVEFADFQSPYSARAASTVHAVVDKYGQQVRFVFRQYPAPTRSDAHLAAEAALAAHAQGKFWQFHDKAFANQSTLDRAALERYAKEIGLDVAKLKSALDDKTYAATVDGDLALGNEVVIDGTPAMFVNGQRVANPTDPAAVENAITAALKSAS